MKVFNSKLAAIGLAAFVFASCSDSNSDPAGGPESKVDVAETITANLTSSSAEQNSLLAFQTTRTQQLMPESSSSQEQLRQEHLLLPTKLLSLLFQRVQKRGVLQKT